MASSSSPSPVVLRGGCMCGKIRYTSTSFPKSMGNCLCVQCRKAAGTPYMCFARYPRSSITWLNEKPKYYRYSSFASRGFCDACGSSLTFEMDERPDSISITPGSIDDWEVEGGGQKIGKPEFYAFAREKSVWFDVPEDGVPRFDGDDED